MDKNSELQRRHSLNLGRISLYLFILGVATQLFYKTVGKEFRIVYIAGWMEYAVNGICLFLLWCCLFFSYKKKKPVSTMKRAVFLFFSICLAGGFVGNVALGIRNTAKVKDIISISPDFYTVMMLKQDRESGKVISCSPGLFGFARESDVLPYTVDGKMKIQWLESDVCAITYISPDDGNVHQDIKTYGTRNRGNDSLPVYSLVDGVWGPENKNIDGWYFRTDEDGVHLKKGYDRMIYEYTDCVQYGEQVMLLCENGLPQWTVVLNEDCVINKTTDLIEQGTISLCKVSMEKTEPQILFGPSLKPGPISTWWELTEERGTILKEQMQKIIQEDPHLSEFESHIEKASLLDGEVYKIIIDSTDIFQIGLLVNQMDLMQNYKMEFNCEIQITSMELLAGDASDFLLSVEIEKNYFDPKSEQLPDNRSSSPSDTEDTLFNAAYQYRIMKGDGVYLAAAVDNQTDGGVGLQPPESEQSIDTGNDPKYRYVIENPDSYEK